MTHQTPTYPTRYPRRLAWLHWVLAAMVIGALVAGSVILDRTPNSDPAKIMSLRMHMTLGIAILILMIWRLVVRFRGPLPPHADAGNAALNAGAKLAHVALYVLVFGMCASGIALSAMAGLPGIVFGGQGSLPADFAGYAPRAAHGIMAKLLMLVIAAHVAGALYHQLVLRDGLMRRMGLRR